jgi:hypothetical protein
MASSWRDYAPAMTENQNHCAPAEGFLGFTNLHLLDLWELEVLSFGGSGRAR